TVSQPHERETNVYQLPARLDPIGVTDVRAPVGGVLAKIHARLGADIKKGELLFEIEAGTLEQDAKNATAAVQRDEARLRQLDEALESARKSADAEKRADLDKLAAERNVAAVMLDLDREEAKRVQADLARRRVTAPRSGRIEKPLAALGSRVDA